MDEKGSKGSKIAFTPLFENQPGTELFLREATLQLSSPRVRFTTQFEMDKRGSTPPLTPGIQLSDEMMLALKTQKAA